MGKTFKRNSKYNNWHKDKHNRGGNKKKFDFGFPKTDYVPQVKNYSPFEDSPEYHESFSN